MNPYVAADVCAEQAKVAYDPYCDPYYYKEARVGGMLRKIYNPAVRRATGPRGQIRWRQQGRFTASSNAGVAQRGGAWLGQQAGRIGRGTARGLGTAARGARVAVTGIAQGSRSVYRWGARGAPVRQNPAARATPPPQPPGAQRRPQAPTPRPTPPQNPAARATPPPQPPPANTPPPAAGSPTVRQRLNNAKQQGQARWQGMSPAARWATGGAAAGGAAGVTGGYLVGRSNQR